MRNICICILLALTFAACGGGDNTIDRPGSNGNGSGTGGNGETGASQTELADETVRFTCGQLSLTFGEPGILYTTDTDGTTVSLIDISTDHSVKFNIREGDLFIDGVNVANNVRAAKRDNSKGVTWYYGNSKPDGEKFYLVLEDY